MAKKAPSKGEQMFAQCLDIAGYPYEREFRINPDRRWRCDFFVPSVGVVVEIEGVRYGNQGGRHQTAAGFTLDCEKYNWIVSNGYTLFRFTPSMVSGKAKSGVKPKKDFSLGSSMSGYIEPAIDTMDRFVLKDKFGSVDRSRSGYIVPYIRHAL
ncbi:MAG: hypothetical protein ISN29_02450 [Gammaproteobacteria bacterium AqS3]|nr:hypothetical protein [Gammaproteobacteria bacterium AqS3]